MDEFLEKIRNSIPLSADAKNYLLSISKIKKVSKGEFLVRQGDQVTKTFYVLKGCLRSYSIDKNAKEHTLQFAIKDWWISDYIAIYENKAATLSVACLADAEVIEFNFKKLDTVYTLFPEFEAFQRKTLERHVVSLHKRILNQLQLNAEERYDLFLKQYPDIEKHIPNYHIASYLGITQQSLSRIRVEKAKRITFLP